MFTSNSAPTSLPDIFLNAIAVGTTTPKQGRVPIADAVPSLATAGKGFAVLTGQLYAYDGTLVGFRNLNYLIPAGPTTGIEDDGEGEDEEVPCTVTLAGDARGNAEFEVQNTGTKVIDVVITNLQIRYFGT
jgi:hypothetical protein